MEANKEGIIDQFQNSPEPFGRAGALDKQNNNSNIFEPADDIFGNSSFDNEGDAKEVRISGNGQSLLDVMTHGNIRQEILQEARKGII
jgi:hypothetical protein